MAKEEVVAVDGETMKRERVVAADERKQFAGKQRSCV